MGVLKVREAAPYGELGLLKTKKSKRDLIITEPVTSLLATYRKSLSTPAVGLLFANDDQPINHNNFAKYYIKPYAVKIVGDAMERLLFRQARRSDHTLQPRRRCQGRISGVGQLA